MHTLPQRRGTRPAMLQAESKAHAVGAVESRFAPTEEALASDEDDNEQVVKHR